MLFNLFADYLGSEIVGFAETCNIKMALMDKIPRPLQKLQKQGPYDRRDLKWTVIYNLQNPLADDNGE